MRARAQADSEPPEGLSPRRPLKLRFTHERRAGHRTEENLFMRIEMLVELLT